MDTTISSPPPPETAAAGPRPLRALLVDDSEDDVLILLHGLRKAGYRPVYERAWTAAAMREALARQAWDIVISDYEMPGFGGFEALQVLKESGRDIPFILVSAVVSEETAVAAMKAGAHDFIMKRKLARLGPAIDRELREAEMRAARKAAEAALCQSEDQLRQAQKLEAVARLAAGVAHDFNNILTAIRGHGELLLSRLDAADARRVHAGQICRCADMASALTRQLLTFSRRQVVEQRVLDLNGVFQNIERMLRRLIGEDIDLRAELDPGAGHIRADPGQIEQVIMNLAVNARDAMPRGGRITATTANVLVREASAKDLPGLAPGEYVMLAIADTGTGMTDEVKAHLFEPFFTTKPAGKGTGLGLATCFGIIQQASAHIRVESELGKGTAFKIYFPRVREPLAETHAAEAAAPVRGGTETVLLVEDEAVVREFARIALREQGYTVIEAGNGEEGLRVAREHAGKIHLLLSDLVMPVMGGKELAETLRSSHPQTRVIFTSGYSQESLGTPNRQGPGIPFLQKPYGTATLARLVRAVLDTKN
jgi:signal transduction histidine kinase